jgi:hypothetical protein
MQKMQKMIKKWKNDILEGHKDQKWTVAKQSKIVEAGKKLIRGK